MPGHVGNATVRQLGLRILRIDHKHNILYVLGQSIPGENGEFVKVFDSKMRAK
jgi:ribosomal protein L3